MRCLQPPARVSLGRVVFRPLPPVRVLASVWGVVVQPEVVIEPHRLVLVERWLGLVVRRAAYAWEDLVDAGLDGGALVLWQAGRRLPVRTFVWGDVGQIAWLVSQIKGRARGLLAEDPPVSGARQRVVALATMAAGRRNAPSVE